MPRYRPATRERYIALLRQGILDAFGDKRLDMIDAPMIRAFVARLRERKVQPRGPANFVRTILRASVETGALGILPEFPKLPRQGWKIPDPPSDAEVRILFAHARGWLRAAIALAVYAGLRSGEIRALEVRDIDLTKGIILVRRAFSGDQVLTPKSGHERVVPIAPALAKELEGPLRDKLPTGRIVLNSLGRTPRRQAVLAQLTATLKRSGLPPHCVHALRHFFCSILVSRGASVEAVRLLAGHSRLDMTQRYVHAAAGDLRAAIAKLSGN